MDFINGFFLVIASLAFGFFIWFRPRKEEEQRLRKLTQENENLRTSLKLAHNSHGKLEERFTRQQGQLSVLQQLWDDWTEGREQVEQERIDLQAQVATSQTRLDEVNQKWKLEQQQRISLEDQCHELNQQHLDGLQKRDEAHRKQIIQLETELQNGLREQRAKGEQCETLTRQLHESHGQVATLQAELESQQQLLETATGNVDGLKQEYVSLESALSENTQLLKSARCECAEQQSAREVAEQNFANLEQQYLALESDQEQLQQRLSELEALETKLPQLEKALEDGVQKIKEVVTQRDQAMESEASAQSVIKGLRQRLENQEATIHRMRSQHDETRDRLRSELESKVGLEATLAEVRDELEEFIEQNEALAGRHTERVAQLVGQRDQLATELDEAQSQLAARSQEQTTRIEQLARQRDEFADKLKASEQELAAVLANHQQRIDLLVEEGNRTRQQYAEVCEQSESLSAQCDQLAELCETLEQQLENEKDLVTTRDQQLEESQLHLSQRGNDLQALREQLSESSRVAKLLQRERDELIQEKNDWSTRQQMVSQQASELTHSFHEDRTELTSRISALTDQRDSLLTDLAESRDRVIGLNEKVAQDQQAISMLQKQVDELETRCQRISELETLVAERHDTDSRTAEELRVLREQYADAYANQQRLQRELAERETTQEAQSSDLLQQRQQAEILRSRLTASEETIRNLRRERAAVLARLANYRTIAEPDATVISFTEAMEIRSKRDVDYDDEYGGPVRRHATRGIVYTEPPKQADDLKRISGIAEVLEARLNDYGIYTFKQIRDWTPEAIDEFSHLLAFRDRIVRDDWIGQARRFYDEKRNSHQSYAA